MIKQDTWQGADVVTLENEQFSVSVLPSIGNNLYRMWDKLAQREVLRVPERIEQLREKPGHFGIPMMMPPNRIRNGRFEFNGRVYQLEINTPQGHHIHGLVRMRPWTVTSTREDEEGLSVTSEFRISNFPELAAQYPHDLTLEVTYTLKGSTLLQRITAANRGEESAPFGFGLHTWFMLDGQPEQWTFQLPVEAIWELDQDLLPTGRLLPLGSYSDLGQGINLQGQTLDTVFQIGANSAAAVLSKPGYSIRYSCTGPFKQWVIFTNGEARDTICIEPYTWVTNAPNLQMDPEITGFRAIAPGQTLEMEVRMDISREAVES